MKTWQLHDFVENSMIYFAPSLCFALHSKKIRELPSFESLPLCRRPILSSVGPKKFRRFYF